jgi:hypothetical protein
MSIATELKEARQYAYAAIANTLIVFAEKSSSTKDDISTMLSIYRDICDSKLYERDELLSYAVKIAEESINRLCFASIDALKVLEISSEERDSIMAKWDELLASHNLTAEQAYKLLRSPIGLVKFFGKARAEIHSALMLGFVSIHLEMINSKLVE